jgi:hypothetical protein
MKMKHLVLSMMAMGLMGAGNVSADEHVVVVDEPFDVDCDTSATVCVGAEAYDVSLKCIQGDGPIVDYFTNFAGTSDGRVRVFNDGEARLRVRAWSNGDDLVQETDDDELLYSCSVDIADVGDAYKHEVKCSSTEGRPAHPKGKWGEEDRVEAEIKWSDATCPALEEVSEG